ncbi:MAG: ParB/Srx family N-terminal domain-containing protein [Lachnospiraceae bacterium]|nr:ParB/Srx family N-terminal domain-containing protein [Lachnospiraceae bacterium]
MGDSFSTRIQKDLEKYSGKRQIVRASILDIMTVRHLSPDQMHVNPDDDFVNPKVGPNEEIIEKYIEEARRDMEMEAMSFDEPIMVTKMEDGEYMIVNGHHRWAAAIKVGLTQVRVVVVNPGMEDMADFV